MEKFYKNPQWRDVKNFEGHYEISNDGRLRSCDKYLVSKHGNVLQEIKGKELKLFYRLGYTYCSLYTDKIKKGKKLSIHRLVIEAFGDGNPSNKPFVNHKNGVRDDNRIENLEWVTHSENMIHSCRVLGNVKRGEDSPNNKKIYQYDLNGNLIGEWISSKYAAKKLGLSQGTITACSNGITKSYNGYIWSKTKLNLDYFIDKKFGKSKWRERQIIKYGNGGSIVILYDSQSLASIGNNINNRLFSEKLKNGNGSFKHNGYIFEIV